MAVADAEAAGERFHAAVFQRAFADQPQPARDGRIQVEIADRGVGIPPRELRKIFRRFYRVGRDMQRTVSGLGLGLFVVRSLVRKQGGRVVATSEGAGRGSRFIVTLRAARSAGVAIAGRSIGRSRT